MTGPCLCGDPCCASCGDPAQCAYEDACTQIVDDMIAANLTPDELAVFFNVGLSAVMNARDMATAAVADAQHASAEHVMYLQDRLVDLTFETTTEKKP